MDTPIGTVTMYPKLERREWIFGTHPDPRDARIAELEAALRAISSLLQFGYSSEDVVNIATSALGKSVPLPEGDMTITVEELDA